MAEHQVSKSIIPVVHSITKVNDAGNNVISKATDWVIIENGSVRPYTPSILKTSSVPKSSLLVKNAMRGISPSTGKKNRVSFLITEEKRDKYGLSRDPPSNEGRYLLRTRLIDSEKVTSPKFIDLQRSTILPSFGTPVQVPYPSDEESITSDDDSTTTSSGTSADNSSIDEPLQYERSSNKLKEEILFRFPSTDESNPVNLKPSFDLPKHIEIQSRIRLKHLTSDAEVGNKKIQTHFPFELPQTTEEVANNFLTPSSMYNRNKNVSICSSSSQNIQQNDSVRLAPPIPAPRSAWQEKHSLKTTTEVDDPIKEGSKHVLSEAFGSKKQMLPQSDLDLPLYPKIRFSKIHLPKKYPEFLELEQSKSNKYGIGQSPNSKDLFSDTYSKVLSPSQMETRRAWAEIQQKKARLKEEFFKVPYEECNREVIMGTMGWRRSRSLPRLTSLKAELKRKNLGIVTNLPNVKTPLWRHSNRAASPEVIRRVTKSFSKENVARTNKDSKRLSDIEEFWDNIEKLCRSTSVDIHMTRLLNSVRHKITLTTNVSTHKPNVIVKRYRVTGISQEEKLKWAKSYYDNKEKSNEIANLDSSWEYQEEDGSFRSPTPLEWTGCYSFSSASSTSGCYSGASSPLLLSPSGETRVPTSSSQACKVSLLFALPTDL